MRIARITLMAMCLAAASGPGTAAAQDPRRYSAPFADNLTSRVFPLLAMLGTAPGWADMLRDDAVLRKLVSDRAARVPQGTCTPTPHCLADAWAWTAQDMSTVETRLRIIVNNERATQALVIRQMRASGRFARHATLSDSDLLAAAWRDTAMAMNRIIDVYAKGVLPRYPMVDAIIFDVADPRMADVLSAHGVATVAQARTDDLFFDPALRYATGLLQMNERIDAGAFRPLLGGENAETVREIARTNWRAKAYTALLVFGHGPEDAQSRTGVMGHIRMAIAADLFARGIAPFIIVSGGNVHPNRTPFNEAVEMKRLLVSQYGVPANRILMEPHARHTTTNLRNCARLLLAADFPSDRPALIVSDHRTIQYIGSTELSERNVREMGVQPGRLTPGPDRFTLAYTPDPVAFHIESTDPLDP